MRTSKVLWLVLFLLLGACQAWADCDQGYEGCISACQHISIYDYVSKRHLNSSDTDFKDRCEKVCLDGKDGCEGVENKKERCEEFGASCILYCPESVYNYKTFKYIASSGVTKSCRNACSKGEEACRSDN